MHTEKIKRAERKIWRRIAKKAVDHAPKSLKLWAKRNVPVAVLQGFDWQGFPVDVIEDQLTEHKIEFSPDDLRRVEALALELNALR